MKNSSAFIAAMKCKCPRCHEGDLFVQPNPYKALTSLAKMPDYCPKCGLATTPEPGFYIGAMYVSYAFEAILVLANFFVFGVYYDVSVPMFGLINFVLIFVLTPLIFRYSRTLYLYLFGQLK